MYKNKLIRLFTSSIYQCAIEGWVRKKTEKKGSGNIARLRGIGIGVLKTSERSVYTQSALLSSSIYDHVFLACT